MRWDNKKPRVALVYDWIDTRYGGAESLLLSLLKLFPGAPIYTSIYKIGQNSWTKGLKIIPSWLDRLPGVTRHESIHPLLPLAFESFDFGSYDLVISLTSSFAKGIVTRPHTVHISYLLSTPRFLWQDKDLYRPRLPFMTVPYEIISSYLRIWDQAAAARPDKIVCISGAVARRVGKYYRRPVDAVIYPPIDLDTFKLSPVPRPVARRDYFLLVSRMVPYKRVDIGVQAFSGGLVKDSLFVVGDGSDSAKLKQSAGKNVRFLGNVDQQRLVKLLQNAKALVCPQEEDFGLTPLEANACGTPVIGFRAGALPKTLKEPQTGAFFYPQTAEALAETITRTDFTTFNPIACRRNAESFSFSKFKSRWISLIASL